MGLQTPAFRKLIAELERLPGIGSRTAERLAYHLLRAPREEALALADAIRAVKTTIRHCRVCYNFAEDELCEICSDPTRDPRTICVVEQPKDVHAIEQAGIYRGRYHVLLGAFTPLEGVGPEDLTIDALLERVRTEEVGEVILATNPSFEGEGTALYVRERLKELPNPPRITRIARGVPAGSHIEHVSRAIISDAIEGRREMG